MANVVFIIESVFGVSLLLCWGAIAVWYLFQDKKDLIR